VPSSYTIYAPETKTTDADGKTHKKNVGFNKEAIKNGNSTPSTSRIRIKLKKRADDEKVVKNSSLDSDSRCRCNPNKNKHFVVLGRSEHWQICLATYPYTLFGDNPLCVILCTYHWWSVLDTNQLKHFEL